MSIQPDVEVLVVVTTEQVDRHTAPDFSHELREGLRRCEAAPDRSPELVVDLTQVNFLDSTGIRELIVAEQALALEAAAWWSVAPTASSDAVWRSPGSWSASGAPRPTGPHRDRCLEGTRLELGRLVARPAPRSGAIGPSNQLPRLRRRQPG